MKKIFYTFLVLTLTVGSTFAQYCGNSGASQCTPSGALTQPGLSPLSDSLPVLVNGTAPTTTIQFKNYNTTLYSGFTVTVQKLRIDSIGNLPAGLCWATDKTNNTYNNSEDGCIQINGITCSDPGVYKLRILVTATVAGLGDVPVNAADIGLDYFVRVKNAGDADVVLDTLQTADFSKPTGYSATAVCTADPCAGVTISVATTSTNASSSTATDGSASATATGGTSPYVFVWSNVQTGSTDTAIAAGTYTVTATDANLCTATGTVTVSFNTAINTLGSDIMNVNIFPNPSSDNVTVTARLATAQNVTVELYNLMGQKMISKNLGSTDKINENFNLKGIAKGTYFVKISTGAKLAAYTIDVK